MDPTTSLVTLMLIYNLKFPYVAVANFFLLKGLKKKMAGSLAGRGGSHL